MRDKTKVFYKAIWGKALILLFKCMMLHTLNTEQVFLSNKLGDIF